MVGENQEGSNKLLAAHELARVLNVPVSWVRVRSHPGASNRLPVVKVGKYVRFDLDEVLCWLRNREEINSSDRFMESGKVIPENNGEHNDQ